LTELQCDHIEVAPEAIFMEQNRRFWLILGRLAILKKKLGATFEAVFFMFSWAKKYVIFEKHCSVRTEKQFFFQKTG
jgi:hypothetical protein